MRIEETARLSDLVEDLIRDGDAASGDGQHPRTQQHSATASAEESLELSQNRYAGGVDTYLQVVIWQTAALTNERNDIDIMRRRLEANVLLIKALGGGWDTSQLPRV
jgi:outer membrane protein TolC